MELEIFKGITHSYDTQEMFAMKSSLKNLNCGFSNHETRNFQGDYPFVWHTRDVCHEKFTQKLNQWFSESYSQKHFGKLTNDIAQHQTYTTRLTNNSPTRLLSWLPVKLLKLTDTATATDNGGEGGGCLSITLTQSLLKMFSALLMTFFPLENIFKIIC